MAQHAPDTAATAHYVSSEVLDSASFAKEPWIDWMVHTGKQASLPHPEMECQQRPWEQEYQIATLDDAEKSSSCRGHEGFKSRLAFHITKLAHRLCAWLLVTDYPALILD
jgi:hypothetical protein